MDQSLVKLLSAMKPKTEEFLYFLLWNCDCLMRPTWRNLEASFESWAYRNGLLRQIERLQQSDLIQVRDSSADRVCRLTEAGRRYVLGGRDPVKQWERGWDGKWRLVLFDIPVGRDAHRVRLRRYLRQNGFGYLQNSVWISPDPLANERTLIEGGKVSVESLILLEARPSGGETDEEIVDGAWDFAAINRRYVKYMEILEARPTDALHASGSAKTWRQWAGRERSAWLAAVMADPLLPKKLLPPGYMGRPAWRARAAAAPQIALQVAPRSTMRRNSAGVTGVTERRDCFSRAMLASDGSVLS